MDLTGLNILGNNAEKARRALGIVSEMERITQLGHGGSPHNGRADELVDQWTRALRRNANARPLRPAQAAVLEMASMAKGWGMPYGLVGSIGVGKGKTLAFMLMPRVFGAKRPIQLIPPDVKEQTLQDEWEWSREYNIVPTTTDIDEWECADGNLRLLITYGQLSRPDASDLLRKLNPDFIGADEAQNLANPRAARTMRFLRFMDNHRETVRFCPMSGTLTQAKLEDFAHLVNLALLDKSPLPRHPKDLEMLSGTINWGSEPDRTSLNYASRLVDWAKQDGYRIHVPDEQARARRAMGYRLQTAPGCVVTTSSSCDAPLHLHAHYPEVTEDIKGALHLLDTTYELPDGTEVIEATHFAANAQHLSIGFYYRWAWEDTAQGDVDYQWLEARRGWAAAVRDYLGRYSREGCDSPFLVEEHVRKSGKPPSLLAALNQWDAHRHKPPPPVQAVWFDYSILAYALNWASQRDRAILWFRSRAVGEMLQTMGIPAMWEGTPDPRATPIVALSQNVYHKGWNLQAWSEELDLEPAPSGGRWEQKLGRMHRQGQSAAEVHCHVLQHTWPYRNAMLAAMQKAEVIEAVTYQPQKLRIAELHSFIDSIENAQAT
jgi:hypothetical protein